MIIKQKIKSTPINTKIYVEDPNWEKPQPTMMGKIHCMG